MIKNVLIILFLMISFKGYSQKDTILYNQFRDYVEWQKRVHNKMIEDATEEKYQMVYADKVVIDRFRHKIYVYSSYDLYWGDESGIGWQIVLFNGLHKKKAVNHKSIPHEPFLMKMAAKKY